MIPRAQEPAEKRDMLLVLEALYELTGVLKHVVEAVERQERAQQQRNQLENFNIHDRGRPQ